jgi:hypothetical protein
MAEVRVEVDGELPHMDRPDRAPVTGTIVACALAGSLAFATATLLLGPANREASTSPTASNLDHVTIATGSSPTHTATTSPVTSVQTSTPTTATTPPNTTIDPPVLATVERAMSEWGRFAVSGDEAILTSFDQDGPQYRSLVGTSTVAGEPYRVVALDPRLVTETRDNQQVRATVEWSRTGETTQRYDWLLTLRIDGTTWRLWTVQPV